MDLPISWIWNSLEGQSTGRFSLLRGTVKHCMCITNGPLTDTSRVSLKEPLHFDPPKFKPKSEDRRTKRPDNRSHSDRVFSWAAEAEAPAVSPAPHCLMPHDWLQNYYPEPNSPVKKLCPPVNLSPGVAACRGICALCLSLTELTQSPHWPLLIESEITLNLSFNLKAKYS